MQKLNDNQIHQRFEALLKRRGAKGIKVMNTRQINKWSAYEVTNNE